jgi:hypothetical protein
VLAAVAAAVPAVFSVESISDADLDRLARKVVERLSESVIREIAWEVVPDLAVAMIRERIREIERDDPRND